VFCVSLSLLVPKGRHCYNRGQRMADWKQITARIRRARTGKDPAGQLSNLFEKTGDAMVAFELARHFEAAGQSLEAAKWYSTAAERFRRSEWKTKAQEAAARLGAEPPRETAGAEDATNHSSAPRVTAPEPSLLFEQNAAAFTAIASEAVAGTDAAPSTAPIGRTKRRRGRRGGRNRRSTSSARQDLASRPRRQADVDPTRREEPSVAEDSTPQPAHADRSLSTPALPIEATPETGGVALRGRFGDPGLSSRLSLLEMQFRRLLTCAPVKFDETSHVPVGPGVLLLTDSDLTTYYYVEACQTLRTAIASLLRGGSSRHGDDPIKPRLADHLGIAESRVAKYLSDHCVVRWLQLDEGASHFAHFVIAVLRPILNE
jgi:hypothetical protein